MNDAHSCQTQQPLRVCIVGAGAAGLITAAAIKEHVGKEEEVTLFIAEKSKHLGGVFSRDHIQGMMADQPTASAEDGTASQQPQQPTTPVYPFLEANLPWMLMDSPLLHFPDIWRDDHHDDVVKDMSNDTTNHQSPSPTTRQSSFPHCLDIARYLETLATKFNLHDNIRYETDVVGIEQQQTECEEDAKNQQVFCTFTTKDSAASYRIAFDRVILCVGRFTEPNIDAPTANITQQAPFLASHITAKESIMHSMALPWSPSGLQHEPFAASNIIVLLGAGSSARDIALKLAELPPLQNSGETRQIVWVHRRIKSKFHDVKQVLEAQHAATLGHTANAATTFHFEESLATVDEWLKERQRE